MAHNDEKQPIIIKRVKKVAGRHHGGAWKVAYADFVTAMMAFFLLLWLLNVTTDEQKNVISSYFSPADPRIAESVSGAGGVMGGKTVATEGSMTSDQAAAVQVDRPGEGMGGGDGQTEEARLLAEMDAMDNRNFAQAEEKLRQAINDMPELKAFAENLLIDMTPEGLRIQIVDQQGKPMFESGQAVPLPHTVQLLQMISKTVSPMPNQISVRGHTDSVPYGRHATYTNWELSADRANTSRRVMMADGLDPARVENVQGKADREHLVPDMPESPRNRRISIILLKQSLLASLKNEELGKSKKTAPAREKPKPRKREDGVLYFP